MYIRSIWQNYSWILHSPSMLASRPILVSTLLSIQLVTVFRIVNLPEFLLFFIGHHESSKFTKTDQITGTAQTVPSLKWLYIIHINCLHKAVHMRGWNMFSSKLRWMNTLPCVSFIFTKGNNFYDFLFAFLDNAVLSKLGHDFLSFLQRETTFVISCLLSWTMQLFQNRVYS